MVTICLFTNLILEAPGVFGVRSSSSVKSITPGFEGLVDDSAATGLGRIIAGLFGVFVGVVD